MRKFAGVTSIRGVCSIVLTVVFMVHTTGAWVLASDMKGWTGNVNAFAGVKSLDGDDWGPLGEQAATGIDADFRRPDWPLSCVVGYSYSFDGDTVDGIDVEGSTSELYVGARKIFDVSPGVRPFVGGGIALVSAEYEDAVRGIKVSDDDSAAGLWLGGGIYYRVARNFNIGLSLRYTRAEVTLYDVDDEAGGLHYGVLFGYHW